MKTKIFVSTRLGDRQFMDIPDLKQSPVNLRIIIAAMNGVIDEDKVAGKETFIALKRKNLSYSCGKNASNRFNYFAYRKEKGR